MRHHLSGSGVGALGWFQLTKASVRRARGLSTLQRSYGIA